MPRSTTLAALRTKWPRTKWRITRGAILPRLRWLDGPSPASVLALQCSDIMEPLDYGRTLSDGAIRILGEKALADLGISVPFLPFKEYQAAYTEDVPHWTAADNYALCNAALARLAGFRNVWGLDQAVTKLSFRHSFEEDAT